MKQGCQRRKHVKERRKDAKEGRISRKEGHQGRKDIKEGKVLRKDVNEGRKGGRTSRKKGCQGRKDRQTGLVLEIFSAEGTSEVGRVRVRMLGWVIPVGVRHAATWQVPERGGWAQVGAGRGREEKKRRKEGRAGPFGGKCGA